MNLPEPFDELSSLFRGGNDAALELMFLQFTERLMQLARSRIASYYRNKVDPEDVVQSVFKSFLKRYRNDKIEINSDDSLWGLLTIITIRKCADRIEYLRAAGRNVRREVSISPKQSQDTGSIRYLLDREPSPEEAVELAEFVEMLFRGIDQVDRPIIEFQLQGFSTKETATMLNRSERTVRRVRARARSRLFKMIGLTDSNDDSDPPTADTD